MNSLSSCLANCHRAHRTSGQRFLSVGTVFTWLRHMSAELDWRVIASSARLLAIVILTVLPSCNLSAQGQKEPDAKRKSQIVSALCSHGFQVANWQEAKTRMQQIAADNGWQTDHVPDARVLVLLDLGNAYSDPQVATQRGNPRLDPPYGDVHD